ncbi:MAG: hypothetical protein H8E41_03170 [Desulfobulbaceae bacterium]|uniref:Uncharacterized protein n=1 Tax=Candidatus Desulfobia pelagia TaxID=2841692 RepID=A0A8J6TBD3_9BACT|nr:hypothetical protein [Candidatus Desulfobia pelagia]
MGDDRKEKKKCCQKYEKKGKHCKSCPELQQCILPFDDYKDVKKKEKELAKKKKKREKELRKKEKQKEK